MILLLLTAAVMGCMDGARAADMRTLQTEVRNRRAALLDKAEQDAAAAGREAEENRRRIVSDRKTLTAAIRQIEQDNRELAAEKDRLTGRLEELSTGEKALLDKLARHRTDVRELAGGIRTHAKDLQNLCRSSMQSALVPDRCKTLDPIVDPSEFPGMDDIRRMVDLLFDEIRWSGEVRIVRGPFVDRLGEEKTADILMLGNFSAAYRLDGDVGFLIYSDTSGRLFALSKPPSARTDRKIRAYMAGKSADVPIDISRGAALRQLTHRLSLWAQIPHGGPIVWPILFIGGLALLIILERCLFLARKHVNADKFMIRVCGHIDRKEWDACLEFCQENQSKPIPRVLMTGIKCRRMNRADLENALQESILTEIPLLERFLSTLGMLAAIAPLLGLLGTVTGMINTFHTITYYGTGDPRLMSGGISEALMTTMLGLSVAIPIMLCHTLLARKVENMIAQMEEKAVGLVNTVFRSRERR